MSVRIKKVILDQQGRIIEEYEGTEAEIEQYEKKKQKKNESQQKKKEILHGKAAKALSKRDVIDELKKFMADEIAKLHAVREVHNWYYTGGWWWRPYYYSGGMTYLYSNTAPTPTSNTNSILMCNSSNELSKAIGAPIASINANLAATNNIGATGTTYGSTYTLSTTPAISGSVMACTNGSNWSVSNSDLSKVVFTSTSGKVGSYN